MTVRRTLQTLAVAAIGLLGAVFCKPDAGAAVSGPQGSKESGCVSCHSKLSDEAIELFSPSVHARVGLSCSRCHGGNSASTEKEAAHAGRFVGKLAGTQALTTCGSCHGTELAQIKSSRHFTGSGTRVDCVGCHGAHSVGSPARNFSLGYYCAGCHGLEYLPEHPQDFKKLLALVDRQTESLNELIRSGRQPSAELLKLRRQTRDLMGEVVHTTNMRGALDKSSQFLKLDEEFKQVLGRFK